jgi:hypothetical protein
VGVLARELCRCMLFAIFVKDNVSWRSRIAGQMEFEAFSEHCGCRGYLAYRYLLGVGRLLFLADCCSFLQFKSNMNLQCVLCLVGGLADVRVGTLT